MVRWKCGILWEVTKYRSSFTGEVKMTSSEVMSHEQNARTETLKNSSIQGIILTLKVLGYLSVAAAIGLSVSAFVFP